MEKRIEMVQFGERLTVVLAEVKQRLALEANQKNGWSCVSENKV